MERWITFAVYLILIVAILVAGVAEKKDLMCPTGEAICGTGRGCAYYHGRAGDHEDFESILDKTRIAIRYDENSVCWRRCLIVSGLIGLLLIPLLYGRFGNGKEVTIIVLIVYIFMYLMLSFYRDHLSRHAVNVIERNLKILGERKWDHGWSAH